MKSAFLYFLYFTVMCSTFLFGPYLFDKIGGLASVLFIVVGYCLFWFEDLITREV